MNIKRYVHHGVRVAVQESLEGNHREHCLCYGCVRFTADQPGTERLANCPISNMVYALCVLQSVVLPVWECPEFVAKE